MSNVNCPCKLTQEKILKLAELGSVPLGIGGVCKNPGDDDETLCEMLLRNHPTEGNKIY